MRRVTGAEAVEFYREQLEAGTMIINGVAEEVGLSSEYVRRLCHELRIAFVPARRGPIPRPKLPRKPRAKQPLGITAEKVATYREQLEKGQLSITAVGKELGISREYVRQLCKKLDIKAIQPNTCWNRKCSTVLRLEERESHYCNGCKPRQKVRSPDCLKAAGQKYKRITVQCVDCGTGVERTSLYMAQSLTQKGYNGPVCDGCRGKRMSKSNAAKVLVR